MKQAFQTWYKKPVAIKAKQMPKPFTVKTLKGTMKGKAGDYLIIGTKGEKYPCDKQIFEQTYTKKQSIPQEEYEYALKQLKETKQKLNGEQLWSAMCHQSSWEWNRLATNAIIKIKKLQKEIKKLKKKQRKAKK